MTAGSSFTSSRIVALDTTSEFGSLALIAGVDVVEEVLLHAPEGFGHVLYGHLERLLNKHNWNLHDVDCFASASGPGSFTGVRIGLAAAKGLAEVTGKPAVAVSNLAAIAWFGTLPLRAAVLDARRGQIYGAVYDAALSVVHPEVVESFQAWLGGLPDQELEFVALDFSPFRPALAGTRFENAPVTQAPRPIASAIGLIAERKLRSGLASDPIELDANYVRHSDAELFWKE